MPHQALSVFIIDDDAMIREMMKDNLQTNFPEFKVKDFSTGEAAMQAISENPDLIVLDYELNSEVKNAANGVAILQEIKEHNSKTPVIMFTGQDSMLVASDTIKYGAYDYIVKNENAMHKLNIATNRILEDKGLKKNLTTQKFFNYLLAGLLLVIVLLLMSKMM